MTPLRYALNEYRQTSVDAGAAYADPHTLISMLFEGLQERLAIAKGAIARGDYAAKGLAIGKAMDIVSYLQACLDKKQGGEIAENLDALYDYMMTRLTQANLENAPQILDEVGSLVGEIENGWSAIRQFANRPSEPSLVSVQS